MTKCKEKECETILGKNNVSGLCPLHLRRKKAKEYYQLRRKEHRCLRCGVEIKKTDGSRRTKFDYNQLCDKHRAEERARWAAMSPEQRKQRQEYQKAYSKSPKYQEYLQKPETKERYKKHNEKKKKIWKELGVEEAK